MGARPLPPGALSGPEPPALGREAAATPTRRIIVGADPDYPREADVRTQLHHARPGLTVHTTLHDTLHAARRALLQLQPSPAG